MKVLSECDQLDIFDTDVIQSLIEYKWKTYAYRKHILSAFFHVLYVVVLIYYINYTYLMDAKPEEMVENPKTGKLERVANSWYLKFQAICLVYPIIFTIASLIRNKLEYFKGVRNYLDVIHIVGGYYSIYSQIYYGPESLGAKVVLISECILSLVKNFEVLKINDQFSPIVTMIANVFIDLNVFLIYFLIQVIAFTMTFSVISRHDMGEYRLVGPLVGNFLYALRLSLGDFNFDAFGRTTEFNELEIRSMNGNEHRLFWIVWLGMTYFSATIFLTFVIARVTDSYQSVKDDLQKHMRRDKCRLIYEAEHLPSLWTSHEINNPKLIMRREQEPMEENS